MSKTNKTIYAKFAAATAEMLFDKTGKDYRGVKGNNYSLDDILPVVKSVLSKYGLAHIYTQLENEKSITSRITIFDTESDATIDVDMSIPKTAYLNPPKNNAGKPLMTDPQWCGAINSYFKRYTYINAFGVSEGDLLLDTSSYSDNGSFVNYGNNQNSYNNDYQQQNNYNNNYQPQTNFAPVQQNMFENNYNEQVQTNNEPAFIQNFKSTDPIPLPDEVVEEQPLNFGIEIDQPKVDVGITTDLVNQMQKVVDSYGDFSNTFNLETKQLTTRINAINKLILDGEITQLKVQNAITKHNDAIIEGEKL